MNKRTTNDSTPYSNLWFNGESLHPRTVGLGVAITEQYQWLSKTNIRCTCWRVSVRACSSSGAKGPRDNGCGKLFHPEQKRFIGIKTALIATNLTFFVPHFSPCPPPVLLAHSTAKRLVPSLRVRDNPITDNAKCTWRVDNILASDNNTHLTAAGRQRRSIVSKRDIWQKCAIITQCMAVDFWETLWNVLNVYTIMYTVYLLLQ